MSKCKTHLKPPQQALRCQGGKNTFGAPSIPWVKFNKASAYRLLMTCFAEGRWKEYSCFTLGKDVDRKVVQTPACDKFLYWSEFSAKIKSTLSL